MQTNNVDTYFILDSSFVLPEYLIDFMYQYYIDLNNLITNSVYTWNENRLYGVDIEYNLHWQFEGLYDLIVDSDVDVVMVSTLLLTVFDQINMMLDKIEIAKCQTFVPVILNQGTFMVKRSFIE